MSEEPLAAPSAPVQKYPIVRSMPMSVAQRSGPLNILGPRRSSHEMLRVDEGHYALVYRVDGEFVRDDSQDHRSDVAVRATHVSVVDIRQNAQVEVQLNIPARQTSQHFTVVATFGCTVTDPVRVVRLGLTDPQQLLSNYLLNYHNVMQMGLDYRIDQINEVRRAIHDELTAYQTVDPPSIDGLEIQNASIDVIPPERQVRFDEAEIEEQYGHMQSMARTINEMRLALERERAKNAVLEEENKNKHSQEVVQQDHDLFQEDVRQQHEWKHAAEAQQHEIERRKKAHAAQLEMWRQQREALGDEIDAAEFGAVVEGGLTHAQIAAQRRQGLAERHQLELEDRKAEREEQRDERMHQRALEEQQALADREGRAERHQLELEDRKTEREEQRDVRMHQRALEEKQLDHSHVLEREAVLNERAQALVEAHIRQITLGADKETADAQRASVMSFVTDLAKRGQLDMMSLEDVESLLVRLSGSDPAKALAGMVKPDEVTAGPETGGGAGDQPSGEAATGTGPVRNAEVPAADAPASEVPDAQVPRTEAREAGDGGRDNGGDEPDEGRDDDDDA